MTAPPTLTVRDFAQIRECNLSFGDLTVLVGAQGTGKSLALQWLKATIDGKHLVQALRQAGQVAASDRDLVDLIFGVGMGAAWRDGSTVSFGGKKVTPATLNRRGGGKESIFFIPAHRSMLVSDGWAAPFQKLSSDTPVVARMFSQNLYDRLSGRGGDTLFPVTKRLKKEYRELIDAAIFHGASVVVEQDTQHAKRMKLVQGGEKLPFMTWSAGQREFTPLLLGLYHLLPGTRKPKQEEIDWVIIEEPEMGLHPEAVTVVILLMLDLLWRGYRVVLSTHSPHVLTAVWMVRRLQEHSGRWQLLCEAFGVRKSAAVQKVAESALEKTYKVHLFSYDANGQVITRDISGLDAESQDPGEAEWGGLTGFSSRFGDAVRTAVNESDR